MRYLAAERRRPQRDAARDRRRLGRRTVPRRAREARLKGRSRPADAASEHGGRAAHGRAGAQEHGRGRRAVLPRLRRLPAPRPGERRSYHPARRVPDQLHALPARDRAGHAADAVRVPDAGRAAYGCEVANASMYDGSTAMWEAMLMAHRDHPAEEGDHLVGLHPHYVSVAKTMAKHRRTMPVAALPPRPDGDAEADRRSDRRRDQRCVVVQIPTFSAGSDRPARRSPRRRTPRARC